MVTVWEEGRTANNKHFDKYLCGSYRKYIKDTEEIRVYTETSFKDVLNWDHIVNRLLHLALPSSTGHPPISPIPSYWYSRTCHRKSEIEAT